MAIYVSIYTTDLGWQAYNVVGPLPLTSSGNNSVNDQYGQKWYATGTDIGKAVRADLNFNGQHNYDNTFVLPDINTPFQIGPFNRQAGDYYNYYYDVSQLQISYGTIVEGTHVDFDDPEIVDYGSDFDFVVYGDVTVRYQVSLNGVAFGAPFLGLSAFTIEDITSNQVVSVAVDNSLPIVEAPSYAEDGRLVLFGKDGGADSQGFSIPDWSAGGVYLIPPTGTIGVHPDIEAGFWKQVGFRSLDGRALPPGNWVVQVYSNETWVDVAGYVIGENQHSSGVSDCFISKSEMREFRIRMAVDSQAPDPPTWEELPSDGGTAGQEETTPVELTPEGEFPEIQVEKPTPPTWEDEPEITEPNTTDCPCSTWYVDIAEQIQWVGYQLSTELEYVGDSIQWVGDVLDQRLEEQSQELRGIREALELIADRLPIEVAIEAQPPYSIQYPGGPEADIESFMDGRY